MINVREELPHNGYFSKDNVQACAKQNIEPLIVMGRASHHLPLAERLQADAPEPVTSDPLVKIAWKLKTKLGREYYGKRKARLNPYLALSNTS